MPISMLDLGWVAGFLEGEGYFGLVAGKTPRVSVSQANLEPLIKLESLLGGKIAFEKRNNKNPNHKDIYALYVSSNRAVQIMLTIYTLMSPKRKEQIERCIEVWKTTRRMSEKGFTVCPNGHEMTEQNTYKNTRGGYIKRQCKQCKKDWRIERETRVYNNVDFSDL